MLLLSLPRTRLSLGLGVLLALGACDLAAQGSGPRTGGGGDFPTAFPRVPIFYPPNPPPLGRGVPALPSLSGPYTAPSELALYVNEIFYPPLGTRLQRRQMTDRLRERLDRYRATKTALQAELRLELERLRDAEPATRARALAELSRRQTPQLVALEGEAEQLRRELITNENTWSAVREWRLGDNPRRGFSPAEIATVMRGYAFYQNGLLPAQRRLLREIAIELQMAADSADAAAAAQPYLFFPPEPARVLLPDDTPADVAAKMAAFQTKKSALKKELYDTIYSHDGERFRFLSNTLGSLVEKQKLRLAELETLAEEIRLGLAHLPEPAQHSERSPLPPRLQARVATVVAGASEAQRTAEERVQELLARSLGLPIVLRYRFEANGIRIYLGPAFGRGEPSAADKERIEALRAECTALSEEYGRRVAEVMAERDAILAEIGPTLGVTRRDAVARAFAAAVRVATARQNESAYREYHAAVFLPGLSPEQRRLLFDSVVEKLSLPLPFGELQPTERAPTW